MSSAEEFATEFGSFWHSCLPMAEGFIRTFNLAKQRFELPLRSSSPPERHALIAEAAFADFRSPNAAPVERVSAEAADQAVIQVAAIVKTSASAISPLTERERVEAKSLSNRLKHFIQWVEGKNVVVDPAFPGCGFIEPSVGDIQVDDMLIEVKAVDRSFRSVDLRQVLMYAALNHAAGLPPIRTLTLMNPRQGTYLSWTPDVVCYQAAGLPASEVYESIVEFVSGVRDYPG